MKKGTHHTEEAKMKNSDAHRGERNYWYGRHHSEETKEKMSVVRKGQHLSEGTKKKLSNIKMGEWANGIYSEHGEKMKESWANGTFIDHGEKMATAWSNGSFNEAKMGTGVSGKRADLNNQFFRSTWEANVARILNYWGVKWEYEVKRIPYNNGTKTHMIDFYLPKTDSYLDIYSYLDERHLEEFYGVYESGLSIQLIGPDIYRDLEKEFKDKLPFWENGRKKTKTLNT